MALDPQKQSEEMLKAWSQQRRDAAGPRFEPDPPTRQLLLNETRRFHGQAQATPEAAGTFRDFWASLYPRLAVALATVAVAGLAIWFISPELAQNSNFMLASNKEQASALLSAPASITADLQLETAKKKNAEVFQRVANGSNSPEPQTPVANRFAAAKSVSDVKDLALEKRMAVPRGTAVSKVEAETKLGEAVASGPAVATDGFVTAARPAPAATPAPSGASAPVTAGDAMSLALNEPKVPELKPAQPSRVYSYGLAPQTNTAPETPVIADRLFKPSSVALRSELASSDTPALQPQAKLYDETKVVRESLGRRSGMNAAENQATRNIATSNIRPIAVAVQKFVQISPSDNIFRNQATQNIAANQSFANNGMVSNNGNISNAANRFKGESNQNSFGLLQSFDLEQNGTHVVLVDADGSVYSGEWISGDTDLAQANDRMNQAVDHLASNGSQQGMGGGIGGVAGAANTQQFAPPRTEVYFHAEGINQTTKQSVALRGFLELATTAPVVQNTQAPGAQALNITRVQAQVSTSTNTPTELYAVPVKQP